MAQGQSKVQRSLTYMQTCKWCSVQLTLQHTRRQTVCGDVDASGWEAGICDRPPRRGDTRHGVSAYNPEPPIQWHHRAHHGQESGDFQMECAPASSRVGNMRDRKISASYVDSAYSRGGPVEEPLLASTWVIKSLINFIDKIVGRFDR